jgi:hypothetical protein
MSLFAQLSEKEWLNVAAMVPPDLAIPCLFLDVVFWTEAGAIRIDGKAHTIDHDIDDEAFSLVLHPFRHDGWWDYADSSKWQPVFLKKTWEKMSFSQIISGPRTFGLYSDPRLISSFSEVSNPLDVCSAIEFADQQQKKKLVLKASFDNPCSVEILTTPRECEEAIAGLTPI